jgi:iron complex outermembrane receptor protein
MLMLTILVQKIRCIMSAKRVNKIMIRGERANLRGGLLASTAALLLLPTPPILAQGDNEPALDAPLPSAQAEQTYAFDIPSQPLPQAIAAFSAVTGLQVLYTENAAFEITAPALQGIFTAEQALNQLVAGSGLDYRYTSADTITLEQTIAKLDDGTVNLEAITVTENVLTGNTVGDRTDFGILGERDIVDTPFSVFSYTEELVRKTVGVQLTDIVLTNPSISTAQNTGSFREILDLRGFEADSQVYLYDGVPGLLPATGFFALQNVEQVQVFLGPNAFNGGGALFGSVGGTLNFIPKRPNANGENRIRAGIQLDVPFVSADLQARFGANDQFGARFNAYHAEGSGIFDNYHQNLENYTLYVDWQPTDDFYFAVEGSTFLSEQRGGRGNVSLAPGVPLIDTVDSTTSTGQPWAPYSFGYDRIYAKASWAFADGWGLSGAYGSVDGDRGNGFTFVRETVINEAGDIEGSAFQSLQPTRDSEGWNIGLDGEFDAFGMFHRVAVGYSEVSYTDDTFDGDSVSLPNNNLYNPITFAEPDFPALPAETNFFFYTSVSNATVSYEVSAFDDQVQALVGLRQVDLELDASFGDYDDGELSPFGGLTYKPMEDISLYVSYSEGLQSGGTAPETTANAGEVLSPGVNTQTELGAKWQMGDLLLTAAYFNIERPLEFVNSDNIYAQDGTQRHEGIEVQALGSISPNLEVIAGIAYIDATIEDNGDPSVAGNRAPGVPKLTATAFVNYEVPTFQGLSVNAAARYQSSEYIDVENFSNRQTDDWLTVDGGFEYDFVVQDLELRATLLVTNIFDEQYWRVGSFSDLFIGNPRAVRASISASF